MCFARRGNDSRIKIQICHIAICQQKLFRVFLYRKINSCHAHSSLCVDYITSWDRREFSSFSVDSHLHFATACSIKWWRNDETRARYSSLGLEVRILDWLLTHLRVDSRAAQLILDDHHNDAKHSHHERVVTNTFPLFEESFPSAESVADIWLLLSFILRPRGTFVNAAAQTSLFHVPVGIRNCSQKRWVQL